MNKYFSATINTWNEMLTYRLSFVMWRVRNVFQLLTIYFLWLTIIPSQQTFFGYSQTLMLTYVLGTAFIGSIVFSTRTHEIGDNINSGNLSFFLAKPISYFGYWFAKDIGDKAMNISFSMAELFILFILLRPPLFIQVNPVFIFFSLIAVTLAVLLYFLIGAILGMIGFWSPEVWAPRFIFFILLQFFAGSLFPLDIFPKQIFMFFQLLPFPYLLYVPLKIYLGHIVLSEIFYGFSITLFWIIFLFFAMKVVWQKGLKLYTAYGN